MTSDMRSDRFENLQRELLEVPVDEVRKKLDSQFGKTFEELLYSFSTPNRADQYANAISRFVLLSMAEAEIKDFSEEDTPLRPSG